MLLINNFSEMLKRGLKTDLNLTKVSKIFERISGTSSGDNESKIQNHCFTYFGSQGVLTAAHMPLGTPFSSSQSSYQCLSVKTPEKICACN